MRTHNYISKDELALEIAEVMYMEQHSCPKGLVRLGVVSDEVLPWAEAVMNAYGGGGAESLSDYGWILDECELSAPRSYRKLWWDVVGAAIKELRLTKAEVAAYLHKNNVCHIPGCDVVCEDNHDYGLLPGEE